MTSPTNFSVKDEIALYWDSRAEGFDASWGHGIHTEDERQAWLDLFTRHIGPLQGKRILELGSGTGIISSLLAGAGAEVTGVDLGEKMLAKARAKAADKGLPIQFIYGDAEDPMVPQGGFDAVVNRHLVWTLPNPSQALTSWRRLLKPGGRLLIIDGEWTDRRLLWRIRTKLAEKLAARMGQPPRPNIADAGSPYAQISAHLPFRGEGAPAEAVMGLVAEAGFADVSRDAMAAIVRAQRKAADLPQWLRSFNQRRYAVAAVNPAKE
ncbi:class I SAM-dependent methyltransferase [Lacibacterium aquatile]|uniref:Class I SAM-dependent methyltransferase n=1 Tax=Lacibacterium aquatile TaxID=1168082 RepID=A0ABW5DUB2_9PROT